ncbi:MAG TPA: DUF1800 domain-containing protein [Phycisphaerales bacterium]|nr:DUF1800 domain-containing protein [Phycisphaerales bacterium]
MTRTQSPPAAKAPVPPGPRAPRSARPERRGPTGPTTSLKPLAPAGFGFDQARHLLWRAGFGGTPEQIQALVSWGLEKSVDHLLGYGAVPYDEPSPAGFDKDLIRPPTDEERALAARARRANDEETLARLRARRQTAEQDDRRQMRRVQHWWVTRMIESPRPLEEKLTLFWHGHLATSYRTIENSYHMYRQNLLFRAHAAGNFGALLFQIIRDPAMLAYLDQNDSRRTRPNENLARELMELFALGVGNYTEQDIKEGARALTGYTFQDDEFVFQEQNHDPGAKQILGKRGNLDGDGFVTAILEHRACAPYITGKLYRFFVADVPGEQEDLDRAGKAVIRELAGTLLRSKYELRPVLRRLFLSEHFYDPRIMSQQIKSPAELVVGAVRSLGTPVREIGVLADAMNLMGQNLFFPPSVAGWHGGRSWINTSTMFVRQNILCFLLTGKLPVGYDALAGTEKYDPRPLLSELEKAGAARDPDAVIDYLVRLTLGGASSEQNREVLRAFAREHGELTGDVLTGLLLLITAMPEYQLC